MRKRVERLVIGIGWKLIHLICIILIPAACHKDTDFNHYQTDEQGKKLDQESVQHLLIDVIQRKEESRCQIQDCKQQKNGKEQTQNDLPSIVFVFRHRNLQANFTPIL